ncbi:MAG: hypothetical protein HZC40_05520 [Chloroflexi bacterium]|nr:hypothetical protein [Chloroflexota bacterium]
MQSQVQIILEPFVRRQMFPTAEDAARRLATEYVTKHLQTEQRKVTRLERKHGMTFRKFEEYLRQRSKKLQSASLKPTEKKRLGRAIMLEEEDWLEWKAASEMLDRWIKLEKDLV